MDFDELKKQIANLTEELKSRCSPETSVLVESLSFMLNMMLKMQQASLSEQLENQTKQIERLSEQLEAQIKINERLVATIEDLQLTIKDLKRQLGQNSKNSSKPPSKDDFNKTSRNKSLREKKQEKRPVDKRATKASV